MKTRSFPVVLAALSLALFLSSPPAAAAGDVAPASSEVADAIHANTVKSVLIEKLGADALGISVSVSGEAATLKGEVAKQASQGLAGEVALSVRGIAKVHNDVTVKVPAGAAQASEDSVKNVALEMKVKGVLLADIGTNALKIEVEAVDGVVSLRGKLDSVDSSKEAVAKTRAIKGVKKVVDLLG